MTLKPAGHRGNTACREDANASVPRIKHDTKGSSLSGIASYAQIMTVNGMRQVQSLRQGDRVITRGRGAVPLRRVEQLSTVIPAIYVFAGTFGHFQTGRDTLLPAAQPVCVRDWRATMVARRSCMILPACALVDGEFVREIGHVPLTLYRLYFDRPQVLYADGMELGSADMAAEEAADVPVP